MSCLLMEPGHPVLLPEAGQGWDCSRAPFCLPLPAQAWPACPPLLSPPSLQLAAGAWDSTRGAPYPQAC